MFAKNNQISGRQATRLLIFDLLGYSALLIPSALAGTAGNDGVFSIGLGILAGFFYLKLLIKVSSKMSGSYSLALVEIYGKTIGNLIKVGYLIYFLLLAGRVTAVLGELVVNELLEKQFQLVILLVLLLVYYGVAGGIESRARVYEILFWILLIPLGIMLLFAIRTVDTDYWVPVWIEGIEGILSGSYQVFLCVSILCLVPFFAEYLSTKDTIYRCAKKALGWTGGILSVLYLVLLGMFGKDALATLSYPAVTMMSRIQMTGGFLKRADALMFGIWFFTLYALINSLVFFAGKLWNVEKISNKSKKYANFWLIGEITAVYFFANAFYHSKELEMLYERFFKYIATPFIVLVPAGAAVILYLSEKVGKERKKDEKGV